MKTHANKIAVLTVLSVLAFSAAVPALPQIQSGQLQAASWPGGTSQGIGESVEEPASFADALGLLRTSGWEVSLLPVTDFEQTLFFGWLATAVSPEGEPFRCSRRTPEQASACVVGLVLNR